MSEKQTYTLTVNGETHQVEASPKSYLMDVLRDQLGLTGVKDGCATGHCGSCMVIKDGEPVRSCLVQMRRAGGGSITTIEGVHPPEGCSLHPVQQAYIDQGAVQCGFCTPGMMMQADHVLHKHAHPDEACVKRGLEGNLCRCTGYKKIVDAVVACGAVEEAK